MEPPPPPYPGMEPPPYPDAYPPPPGRPNYLKGALIGGLIAAVPSAFLACCCFLFFGVGGVIGAAIAARTAPVFRAMEGAIAGFAVAVGGWVAYACLHVPLAWWIGRIAERGGLSFQLPNLPQGFDLKQAMIAQGQPQAIAVHLVVAAFVFAVTSTVGGCAYGLYLNRGPRPPESFPASPPMP